MNQFKVIVKVGGYVNRVWRGHEIEVAGKYPEKEFITENEGVEITDIDSVTLLDKNGEAIILPDFLDEALTDKFVDGYFDDEIMEALRDQGEAHKDDAAEAKADHIREASQ